MPQATYRFEFPEKIDFDKAKQTVFGARILTEFLHGETATQLGAVYQLDAIRRECRIRAVGAPGHHFCRLLTGLLEVRFGADSFRIYHAPSDEVRSTP